MMPPPAAAARRRESLMERGDSELVELSRTGNQAAFRELVERYKQRAYWVAHGMVSNHDDAVDIAQEAFIRVFKALDRFDPKLKFYTWLYQIIVNLCIDHLRKGSGQKRVSLDDVGDVKDRGEAPHSRMERSELSARVHEVLATLPPKYKTVMMLREVEGLSSKEIAEVVGSTHATIRWRLHRARNLFRVAWEERFKGSFGLDRGPALGREDDGNGGGRRVETRRGEEENA